VIIWGKYEKKYKRGTKVREERPESEWLTVEAPHLRIISDELWFAAHAQMRGRISDPKKKGEKKNGGPPTRYMLSGIGKCACCGGPMTVVGGKDGKERARSAGTDLPELEDEARKLRSEIDNLVSALAGVNDKPAPIVQAIAERNERLSAIEDRLRAARTAPEVVAQEVRRMEDEAKRRTDHLRGALDRNPEEGPSFAESRARRPRDVHPHRSAGGAALPGEGQGVSKEDPGRRHGGRQGQ
jgi:site-specific DNA recombinase